LKPSYTACQGLPNGRVKTLSPGTYCNQTFSGDITLQPGIYILRGGTVNLGGNGALVGSGVTIFLMEDARFSITANQTVQLSPPDNGDYAGITIYQPRTNKSQVTINGGSDSYIEGFIYAPGAHVFHAGNSDTGANGCLRIVGNTIEMTGASNVRSDCEAELGGRKLLERDEVRLNRSAGDHSRQGRGRRRRSYRDTAKPVAEGFGPNGPGPPVAAHSSNAQRSTGDFRPCWFAFANQRGGFPLAGARFVRPLGRCTTSTRASFRADRLAIGETELFQSDLISL
jgi:hypothetical protein